MSFTIGSLFDGSGGFPLAASLCGGTPKWASEIEPYPIAVTKSRFPDVKHLGSVTDIKGGEVEPVDVITFGSPCPDLSVAGLRKGLKHEANGDDETTRSGLFMEAVRIIKEMREATNGVYPRFAVWENVPGAFSSNKGEDFRIVLEELIKVVEPSAVMPEVPKGGWPYADSYCGDRWSIAYRVLDAQYWGVPQRRRRIYLVADFRGECAGKVSFEREGLRGYFETGRTPWQAAPGDAEAGFGTADCERNSVAYGFDQGATRDVGKLWLEEQSKTLTNGTCPGHHNGVVVAVPVVAVYQGGGKSGANFHNDLSPTLTCTHGGEPAVAYAIDQQGGKGGANYAEEVMPTLCSDSHGTPHAVAYPYTLKIRSGCEGGGKGALVQEDKSAMLATNNDQYLFQPVVMNATGVDVYNQALTGDKAKTLNSAATDADHIPCTVYSLDEKMGQTYVWENTANTLAARDFKQPQMVAFQTYQKVTGPLMANSHPGSYTGQDAFNDMLVAGKEENPVVLDRAFFNQGEIEKFDPQFYTDGTVPTLVARGPAAVAVRYIVRRLTPTECARLQGFPDTWGHPIVKNELTDEEYQFWLNVRNTHAAINDKATKEYTKDQILKWYNGLHTDSSEYKMWGNGIALPNALYVMQGIADVMSEEKASRKKWLDDLLGGCL